jgi:hypothetical protein
MLLQRRHIAKASVRRKLGSILGRAIGCSEDYVPHCPHANEGMVPQLRHEQFLPNLFQCILYLPTVKEEIRRYSSPQRTLKRPSREPHGATREQATVLPGMICLRIPSVIVVFVVLLFKA